MCLFVCHAVTQLTNPWTACLPRERGQISAPVWQGGTSHRCLYGNQQVSLTTEKKWGLSYEREKEGQPPSCTTPIPRTFFFSCWGSSGDCSDREKEQRDKGTRQRGLHWRPGWPVPATCWCRCQSPGNGRPPSSCMGERGANKRGLERRGGGRWKT